MTQAVQVAEFNIETASDEQWRQLLQTYQQSAQELNPAEPAPDLDNTRKSLEAMARDAHSKLRLFVALQNDVVLGRLNLQTYPEAANIGIYVVPDARRQCVGCSLLEKAVKECQLLDIDVLQGESVTSQGNAFAEHFGGTVGTLVKENRLYLTDVDWSLVTQWVTDCQAKNPDVTIETFEGLISDDDTAIEQYAHLYTEVANQVPYEQMVVTGQVFTVADLRQEDVEHRNIGMRLWTKVSREANGMLSGLTEITYNPAHGFRAIQGLTGVKDEYRGRSLGKWLKADMLLFLREKYPDIQCISTTNSNVNAPMLSINERLGFKFHRQRTMYKFAIADIIVKLAQ